jgi:hypothetical protein
MIKFCLSSALILCILLSITSCKKEIDLPSDSLKQIYGTWNLVQSIGLHGAGEVPAAGGYKITLNFNSVGEYGRFRDSIQQAKGTFTISQETDSLGDAYVLHTQTKYRYNGTEYKKEEHQILTFGNNDTLFLNSLSATGLNYIYTKIQ